MPSSRTRGESEPTIERSARCKRLAKACTLMTSQKARVSIAPKGRLAGLARTRAVPVHTTAAALMRRNPSGFRMAPRHLLSAKERNRSDQACDEVTEPHKVTETGRLVALPRVGLLCYQLAEGRC